MPDTATLFRISCTNGVDGVSDTIDCMALLGSVCMTIGALFIFWASFRQLYMAFNSAVKIELDHRFFCAVLCR